jgi:aspartate-semialdehyde dehydrogenase
MDPTKKLIVPEINASELTKDDKIIATKLLNNPNGLSMPLASKYNIKRVIVSTYQSILEQGVKAVQQLENDISIIKGEMAYNNPIL